MNRITYTQKITVHDNRQLRAHEFSTVHPAPSPSVQSIDLRNSERRVPIVFLLDNSVSMQGKRIQELDASLERFARDLRSDALAAMAIEIACIQIAGTVKLVTDGFVSARHFRPPSLRIEFGTWIGLAILEAASVVEHRIEVYHRHGIQFEKPQVILLTDGEPTDDLDVLQQAASRIQQFEAAGTAAFHGWHTQDVSSLECLRSLFVREPRPMSESSAAILFAALARSLRGVSRGRLGDNYDLDDLINEELRHAQNPHRRNRQDDRP